MPGDVDDAPIPRKKRSHDGSRVGTELVGIIRTDERGYFPGVKASWGHQQLNDRLSLLPGARQPRINHGIALRLSDHKHAFFGASIESL